jgi:hypothetical protein
MASTSRSASRPCPCFDLLLEPQQAAAGAQVDHGFGEVGVPPSVHADAVAVAEAKNPGDFGSVDQIFDVDSATHARILVAMCRHVEV